jgi:hypothetical protein
LGGTQTLGRRPILAQPEQAELLYPGAGSSGGPALTSQSQSLLHQRVETIQVLAQVGGALGEAGASGGGDGKWIRLRRPLEADPAWRLWGRCGEDSPLLQATGERAAVLVVLLAEGLQVQAAPQILINETTYFDAAAAFAS